MSHFVELKFIATIRPEEMWHITASSTRERGNLRQSAGGPNADSTQPIRKHCKWEREWLREFKWKEVRAVQSCHSISVMTNLCLCFPALASHLCPSISILPLPVVHPSSFYSVVLLTDHFSPSWGSLLLRSAVCLPEHVIALSRRELHLFNLGQHCGHLSVHQASHQIGPASEHPSHAFLWPCMCGAIAHLFHLSVCSLIHLFPDPRNLNKHPEV